ncbi:MAG: hypothetical protein ACI4RN_02630 [Oscillospiraceae bacterium]
MGGRGGFSKIKNLGTGIKINMQFFGRKQTPLYLPKKEYGKLIHEVDTLYNSKYSNNKVIYHYSGKYEYRLQNKGYNNYVVLSKRKIK